MGFMVSPWKAKSLPDVRRLAVGRVLGGESPGEVAESLLVTRRSVERWVRAWANGGDASPGFKRATSDAAIVPN